MCCTKNYQHEEFDEEFKERIFNTYKFSSHVNNEFVLLLLKGISLFEYMENWEKLNEASLPRKNIFYSHWNMEDISDAD